MNTCKSLFLAALAFVLLSASCEHVASKGNASGKPAPADFMVAFYNVENLFDTNDDPRTEDEDFTPEGKLHWTEERYQIKLDRLSEVIDSLPGILPALVGLCEVENRKVLEDLVAMPHLKDGHYAIIHEDSPDERGIDVAMLYNPDLVTIESSKYTTINLPDSADPHTRALLYVKARINGRLIHLYVNHWPSRSGGQQESEPFRVAVANVLEMQIGQVLAADKNANILVMGDFNDFPSDKSVAAVLNAGQSPGNRLFNYMYDNQQRGEGSYFYKGSWSPLDQFIGSPALHEGKNGLLAADEDASYFRNDLVMFKLGEDKRPNRTYVGEDYKGGYSDHLPIYIRISLR